MPTNIHINNITGATPFNIYLCYPSNTSCIYIDTIPSSSLPYDFLVPSILEGELSYSLKVIDNNDCVFYQNVVIGPPPAPTNTPTNTPTQTPGASPSQTPTQTTTQTPTQTPGASPSQTPTMTQTQTSTQTPTPTPTTTTTSPPLDCSFTVSAQEVQTVTFDQELYRESDGTLYGTLTVVRPVRFKAFAELFNPGNAQIQFFCTGFAPTIGIINNDEYTVAYSNPSSIVTAGTYNYEMIVNIAPDDGFTAGCGVTYEEA